MTSLELISEDGPATRESWWGNQDECNRRLKPINRIGVSNKIESNKKITPINRDVRTMKWNQRESYRMIDPFNRIGVSNKIESNKKITPINRGVETMNRGSLTFNKTWVGDIPVYQLISCKGILAEHELPKEYLREGPHFWLSDDTPTAIATPFRYLECGENLTLGEYSDFTAYLAKCGERLAEILKDEAESKAKFRKAHVGTITYSV